MSLSLDDHVFYGTDCLHQVDQVCSLGMNRESDSACDLLDQDRMDGLSQGSQLQEYDISIAHIRPQNKTYQYCLKH